MIADEGVRPALVSDAEAIAAIFEASLPDPWSPAMIADALKHGCRGVVTEDGDGTIEGVALVQVAVEEAELLQVAVAPAARRRGLGGRLVRAALALAARAGARELFLEVRPSNAAARALYAAEGFREEGLRRGYYRNGEDALVLRKALGHSLGFPGPVR
jgi:ribosomal-protein-alanine N-acetyltransferase